MPKTRKSSVKSRTIGRQAFALISAVEGIFLTLGMEQDFKDFDKKAMSPAERRKVIAEKYGKVR